MPGLNHSDHLTASYRLASAQGGHDGFETGNQPARVPEGKYWPIHHGSGEVHGAVGRSPNYPVGSG